MPKRGNKSRKARGKRASARRVKKNPVPTTTPQEEPAVRSTRGLLETPRFLWTCFCDEVAAFVFLLGITFLHLVVMHVIHFLPVGHVRTTSLIYCYAFSGLRFLAVVKFCLTQLLNK